MFNSKRWPQNGTKLLGVTGQNHLTSFGVLWIQEIRQGYNGFRFYCMTSLINEYMSEMIRGKVSCRQSGDWGQKTFNSWFQESLIVSKSYIAHVATKKGSQSAENMQTFRKIGYCSDCAYSSHSQEHRGELFSIWQVHWVLLHAIHNTLDQQLNVPFEGEQWLSVLLKNTSVTAGDSNPHSADQKHQSLNAVLLTAQPRHFQLRARCTKVAIL